MYILVVEDQEIIIKEIISGINNSSKTMIPIVARNLKEATKIIQSNEYKFAVAIVDLNIDYSDEVKGFESEYGWLIITIIKLHQPFTKITINSDITSQVRKLYLAYEVLNVYNVIPKNSIKISERVDELTEYRAIELPPVINANYQSYLNNFTKKQLLESNGLNPTQTVVMMFEHIKEDLPKNVHDGKFIETKDGKQLDRTAISKVINQIKIFIEKNGGVNLTKDSGFYKFLVKNNLLCKGNKTDMQVQRAIKRVASGEHAKDVAQTLENIDRNKLRKIIMHQYMAFADAKKTKATLQEMANKIAENS